jgi:hypothetical protein
VSNDFRREGKEDLFLSSEKETKRRETERIYMKVSAVRILIQ